MRNERSETALRRSSHAETTAQRDRQLGDELGIRPKILRADEETQQHAVRYMEAREQCLLHRASEAQLQAYQQGQLYGMSQENMEAYVRPLQEFIAARGRELELQ